MQFRSRALAFAALGVAPLLLVAACGDAGDTDGSSGNLTPIQGSSYVTLEPVTTTTTTTLPPPTGTLEPGTRSPSAQTYVIQANDTLFKIATLYDVEIETICSYNSWSDCIDPPHLLLPGDEIQIPPDALVPDPNASTASETPTETPTESEDTTEETDTGTGCTHTIAAGENPTKVANQYDITYEQLQAANPGMDFTTTFVVGDVLTIPPEGNCG